MYENYAKKHPVSPKMFTKETMSVETGPFVPAQLNCGNYWVGAYPFIAPVNYTDWRDEYLSWHLTCSLSAVLNPSYTVIIRGPEAKKFLSENFVNNIENFPIGLSKHGVMCTEEGLVAAHGVLIRTGEEEYEAFWHCPYIEYAFNTGNYDAELIEVSDERYLFQLQGPASLSILEEVCEEDLHDLEYRHFRNSQVDGNTVRIFRFGMSGGLGYEIQGDAKFAKDVYMKIIEKGAPYGIRPIGVIAYMMDHTAGGFSQNGNNFMTAEYTDPKFVEYTNQKNAAEAGDDTLFTSDDGLEAFFQMTGSMGPDISTHFFNPYEVDLGRCINWKHEFRGKAALEKIKESNPRKMVTLKWNAEDVCAVFHKNFEEDGADYKPMDYFWGGNESPSTGKIVQNADKVLDADGNEVGVSLGRTYDPYFRVMLSLGVMDAEHQAVGTEVEVLWGDEDTKKMKIRATVVETPFNKHLENASFDVETIPHPKFD